MRMSTKQAKDHPPTLPSVRKRTSLVVLICVAVMILALVGGSLLWLLRDDSLPPGRITKATPDATATGVPTWVPTQITPPAESFFYDTFVNNSHGWSLSGDSGYFRLLVDNMLILANINSNTTLVESVPASTTLDNYLVSIDFTINQGDAHDSTGLYLRGDSNLDHDYRVDINGDGTIDIAKEWLDSNQIPQVTMLFPPQRASDLHPLGTQNTLTIIMINDTITVLINNLAVTTVSDSSYTNGQIALFAHHGKSSSGITVSFSLVEIDHLASLFPTPVLTPTITPAAGQP
jgi:hypothetical protein